ncbi:MAG TPA: tripartite tricarboxylate transporter substrate binding protein [Burkholderiales bacterium]|nr:tripartite tricarboxylate transporter substrate binding protein [Burkholderiales bacterium]
MKRIFWRPAPISTLVLGTVLAGVAVFTLAPATSYGQAYPGRPIRVIVPQSAGGSTDLVARAVGQRMADALGQPVVVDNRPGAGSINGTDIAAKATPDGYTLLVVAASFTITPNIRKKVPYDVIRDFTPVSQLVTLPHIVVVHPSLPVKSIKELIALAKAKPGELNFASSGIGTSTHMATELFMYLTDTKMVNIPYKGGAPGMTALLGGQVQLYFAAMSTAIPHVRAGRLRALAVSTAKRSVAAPEYPTMQEAGVPEYEHASWVGMLAPDQTPRAVITQLHTESVKALEVPEVRTQLLRSGVEPLGSSPKEFERVIRSEVAKWARVVKAAGIEKQ